MSLFNLFNVAGTGMSAQSVRLNTTASNLANAESIGSSTGETYRSRQPIFAAMLSNEFDAADGVGVRVAGIVESQAPLQQRYAPEHPLANKDGYILMPNVNVVEEMANMISASRSYQANAEIVNTTKQLLQRTLALGE